MTICAVLRCAQMTVRTTRIPDNLPQPREHSRLLFLGEGFSAGFPFLHDETCPARINRGVGICL